MFWVIYNFREKKGRPITIGITTRLQKLTCGIFVIYIMFEKCIVSGKDVWYQENVLSSIISTSL